MGIVAKIILCLILVNISNLSYASSVGRDVKKGNNYYKNNEFDRALEKYRNALEKEPNSSIINYNLGTALYRKEAYDKTLAHFQKSLLTEDEMLKEKIHYNLGNAFYQSGIGKEKLNEAINLLKQSLKEYEKTLNLNKTNEDALFNHKFVTEELKRLEKEQKQQQQNEQDQQQQKNSQKDQNSNSDQSKKDQEQDQKSQEKQADEKQEKKSSEEQDNQKKDESGQSQASNNKDQKNPPGKGKTDPQQMTREEAQMLLEGYNQNEEPKEMLNFQSHNANEPPALKDW
jgi:hypothetical protein